MSYKLPKLSIQQKLTFTMVISLLLFLIIVTVVNNYSSRSIIKNRVQDLELPNTLSMIKNDIERQLTAPIQASKMITENLYLLDWLTGGENEDEVDEVTRYLASYKTNNKAITVFYVSNSSYDYFTDEGLSKTLDSGKPSDQWYFNFIKSNNDYIIDTDVDNVTGILTVFINYRIKQNGKTVGVGGLGLPLKDVSEIIKQYRIGKSGYVYLVDAKGTIRIHPFITDNKVDFRKQQGIGDIADRLIGNHKFVIDSYQGKDNEFVVASTYIPSLGWNLITEIPKDEIYSQLSENTRNMIISNSILAVIFIVMMVFIAKSIASPIKKVTAMLKDVAQGDGDLNQRLQAETDDEIGELADAFNTFVSKLQSMFKEVVKTTEELFSSVEAVSSIAEETKRDVMGQRDKINHVVVAIHEMGQTIQEIARNASEAADSARLANEEANSGVAVVERTKNEINEVSEEVVRVSEVIQSVAADADNIGTILDVIRGIAEQTNLLALNAAIEAARAGEQGRGFAVVADEVRALASRTQSSTEEIQQMIQKLQSGTSHAVSSMEKGREKTDRSVQSSELAGTSLSAITKAVEAINGMNIQIATATEEQSVVIEEINRNVVDINDVAEKTSDGAENTSHACAMMREQSKEVERLIGQFKV